MNSTPPHPTPTPPERTLADDLEQLQQLASADSISFGQLVDALGHRAGTSLLVILSFAFVLVPVPGVSTAASVVFLALAVTAVLGTRVYLPGFARRRSISQANAQRMLSVASRGWGKVGKWVRPRLTFLTYGPFRWLAGVSLLTAIVAFALPIPIPFNNSPPAFCMLLLGLGLLARDGLVLLLGHVSNAVMWVILFIAGDLVFVSVWKGLEKLGWA